MSDIILATTSEAWEKRVRHAFDDQLNGEVRRREDSLVTPDVMSAVRALVETDPRVVMVGPGVSVDAALELARGIDGLRPDVCVILVADPTPELLRQALQAGVRDVVTPDATLSEIRGTVERAIETASRRRATSADERARATSKVIAVVSPKGGAGKTAVASNLAVGLSQRAPNEVALVDLDLQFGDVGSALRLACETTVADVSRSLSAVDATTLKAFLTPYPPGLFVLCAPPTPAVADDIAPEHVSKVLDLIAGGFRYVVIDTAAGLDEVALAAMERATDLVVVCGTDVASARGARKELDAFDLLGLTTQRRHFVLNRADARVGLSVADIEATVGLGVDISIPSSRAVPLSMNQGVPMLETDERSPVSRAFLELVHRIDDAASTASQSAAPSGIWRRRKEMAR